MKSVTPTIFIFLVILLSLHHSHAQIEKVKVKKDKAEQAQYKNDTCDFSVIIDKTISGKTLTLQSLDTDDNFEKEILSSPSFRGIFIYLNQKIEIKPITIQAIFSEICKIRSYKLRVVKVMPHKTKNPSYQNRVDIFLIYSK